MSPVGSVAPGQTLTYTLTPRNNGRAIRDLSFASDQATTASNTDTATRVLSSSILRITDTLPAGLSITSAFSGAGWVCSGTSLVVCDRTPTVVPMAAQADLPAIVATVRVLTAACPGPITNTAVISSVQAPYSESASGNNTASVSNALDCRSDLSVTKSNGITSPTSLVAGSTTNYTITFSNAGPGSADGALARDTASAGLSSCSVISCSASGGNPAASCPAAVNWPNLLLGGGVMLPNFPSSSSITFTVSCRVSATGL